MDVWPGRSYPLGATCDDGGTNFSVFSSVAERVELCLFDERGTEKRVNLPEVTAHCWHGFLPGVGPGQRYGYRVYGTFRPEDGLRCNPNKLLLDPYAKAIDGKIKWDESVYGYTFGAEAEDLAFNDADSAAFMPKCVVVDNRFDWGNDRPPNIALHDSMIYEVHVKGFTKLHPTIPEHIRGTYAGLATPEAIEHLHLLGVTAVELLPVHHFVDDHTLQQKGLHNYWGYNSIGFFAPHASYSASGTDGQQVTEFKQMVKALHEAGIEVILDVVYNHTAEGNHMGPTLSFKGIDNPSYYRLTEDARFYMDYTGTGNSLYMREPFVLQLLMDSLRYWITEMHVDGFRFDLASTLARELHDVDRLSAFFDVIQQDPVVRTVKLIAEPWDVGDGGYQVGNFPPGWSEWNGKYRDTMRDFWRGEEAGLGEFAYRFTGSSDLYEADGRRPGASVNFVTAHDGFTLRDLVSFNEKHNEANGEENRDGTTENRSWNCGVEGPTDDPAIAALRLRQMKNLLATLLLSEGTPMLLAGDEIGRTQQGNNNAYCQDDDISWIGWAQDAEAGEMLAFAKHLLAVRKQYGALRAPRFLTGETAETTGAKDLAWLLPSGAELTDEDWQDPDRRAFGMLVDPRGFSGGPSAEPAVLLLLNSEPDDVPFTLPDTAGEGWRVLVNTAGALPEDGAIAAKASEWIVRGRSLAFFVAV
jgi:isoamylase